jgi:hypothetical protein
VRPPSNCTCFGSSPSEGSSTFHFVAIPRGNYRGMLCLMRLQQPAYEAMCSVSQTFPQALACFLSLGCNATQATTIAQKGHPENQKGPLAMERGQYPS